MIRNAFLVMIVVYIPSLGHAREWEDSSGKYYIDAELLARNETMVVLEKTNKQLIGVSIDKLSERDQEFLASKEDEAGSGDDTGMQEWTLRSGLKIRAALVDYVRRDVVIQRRRGKVFVNDKQYEKLPAVYKKMVPQIVTHFENVQLEKEKDFVEWVKDQRGVAKTFTCEGVLVELETGDLYGVPFFFFSKADLQVLQPGWDDWVKSHENEELREQQALSLRAESLANRQQEVATRKVAMLQLQLQGYSAGLFDLWEVTLLPPPTVRGTPLSVVVPARDSRQAKANALAKNPNYRVGAVAKVSRKN